MPQPYVQKLARKHGLSDAEAEARWTKAKKKAADAGHADDYAYVTTIFKSMMGEQSAAVDDLVDGRIRDWFADHPNPNDAQVHEFARELGLPPAELERHIYHMFTDENRKSMKTILSSVTKRVLATANSKLELAFSMVIPVSKLPPEPICDIMSKLAWAMKFETYFLLSDQLTDKNYVFEAHHRDPLRMRQRVLEMLPKFGWSAEPGRTDDMLIVKKGSLVFHLMFLNQA